MAHYTDEYIAELLSEPGNRGYYRAAGYLVPFTPEDRDTIVSEATIMSNMTPGWRWADAVDHVARQFSRGNRRTPYIEENESILAHERAQRNAQIATQAALLGIKYTGGTA